MLKGNKGEWSEVYTLLKLLGDKELFVGDKDLNKIPGLLYPIIKILRDEKDGSFEYFIEDEIKIIKNGQQVLSMSIEEFKIKSQLLLLKIKENKASSFQIPEIENFLNEIKCTSLKAGSSVKTDIRIVVHDLKTNQLPELGFSIKSQLGSPSTLLNAGKTTNFIYEIDGDIDEDDVVLINLIDTRGKIKDRINKISEKDCQLIFSNMENDIFKNNLVLIDSLLPEILSEIVKTFYSTNYSKVSEIVANLEKDNPLNFDIKYDHKYYEYKIKKFLTEIAIGMMPATVWKGLYDATGGYLVVKEDGDVLAYHLYNRNEFEDYLYYNTKLDTASSSRHEFGVIYDKDGNLFFKLNLQIRFIK